jgi:hypothetical protein
MPATSSRGLVAWQRPGPDRWSPDSGRPPAVGRHLCLWDSSIFFDIFLFKKKEILEVWVMARAFERMGLQHPHFLKLAPTLGSANTSKIHGEWRFHFSP